MPSISVEDREKSGWFFSCLAQRSLLLPTEASNIRYPNSRVQNGIQAAMKSEPSAVALCGGNQLGSYCDFFHFFLFYIRWFTATYCDKLSTERNRNDLRGAELFTQYYQMCVLNMIQIFNNTDIYVFINPDASLSSCRFLFGWKPTRISLTSFFQYIHELKRLLSRPETLSSRWLIIWCSGSQSFFCRWQRFQARVI